ncbi:MAG: membrane biogenesis protein [Candidatus Peribacteria bacterium]|jgi:predicted TIM-barrel enzyme|nr:membrane biogenesis protein [Candidatus Peribacteria bacterium]
MKNNFLSLFEHPKPIIGMIHLSGDTPEERLAIAKMEINTMVKNGIDAVLVENYFGGISDVENILSWLASQDSILYGINLLSQTMPEPLAFNLASKYRAKFIQVDSVAGHLPTSTSPVNRDSLCGQEIEKIRSNFAIPLIGGVRFKYQPVLSGRTLEEDLKIGMQRCDAIAITGAGTGIETDLKKIQSFRDVVGDFPLVVAAGMTAENCVQSMQIADACIVGSYLKDTYKDDGIVCERHVQELVEKIRQLRK